MNGGTAFDTTRCATGEESLGHSGWQQFFWFDINAHRLYTRENNAAWSWQLDEYVSAAGWVDAEQLIIALENVLSLFDLRKGAQDQFCAVEAVDPRTRSRDCYADAQSGFWIGPMGVGKEPESGAIWRDCRCELRQIYPGITISNAICFALSGDRAFLTDTPRGMTWRQRLDACGLPKGAPEVYLDLPVEHTRPDGAAVDVAGDLWSAQYGDGRVACFCVQGDARATIVILRRCTTLPDFGGQDLRSTHVVTVHEHLTDPVPADGQSHILTPWATGQAGHLVII